jgi:hypothetical protein
MKKMIIGIVAAAFFSLPAWAQDALLKAGHPDEYTVKKGDTLWDISSVFLQSPWKWPEIWHANPQIENPHLIFPGDLIRLVYIDGQARITSERALKLVPGQGADAKLSPSVRVLDASQAISAIPLDRIDAFLSRSRVVDAKELAKAPYIVAGPQQRIVMGAGDESYARGKFGEDLSSFGLYRQGQVFVDPHTREVLGTEALAIGAATVKSYEKDLARLNVVRAKEEVRVGDRLLPTEDRATNSIFYPSAPDADIKGSIIAVEEGVTQVGKYNVVVLNRGEREGLKVGNVLAINRSGETVVDRVAGGRVKLPDERAGVLMVFRTFKKLSFGLVLEADRPLAVGDTIANP